MLPHFEVDAKVDHVSAGNLRVVWIDEVAGEGIGDNRMYADMTGVGWSDVEEVIGAEAKLVSDAASRAGGIADFDRIADQLLDEQYPGEDLDEGPLSEFALLDVGVMAAVASLSAAGCVTTTSCRGHAQRGEANPLVRFSADGHRLPLIRAACTRSGCGLLLDHAGMLQLYAADVLALIDFAKQVLDLRDSFDQIEPEVACKRPGDNLLQNYDHDVRWHDLDAMRAQLAADQPVQCTGQLSLDGT